MRTHGHEMPPLTIAALIADLRPRPGLLRAASVRVSGSPGRNHTDSDSGRRIYETF
jgi:hypothetical protein